MFKSCYVLFFSLFCSLFFSVLCYIFSIRGEFMKVFSGLRVNHKAMVDSSGIHEEIFSLPPSPTSHVVTFRTFLHHSTQFSTRRKDNGYIFLNGTPSFTENPRKFPRMFGSLYLYVSKAHIIDISTTIRLRQFNYKKIIFINHFTFHYKIVVPKLTYVVRSYRMLSP
jgi:hypothetical protein